MKRQRFVAVVLTTVVVFAGARAATRVLAIGQTPSDQQGPAMTPVGPSSTAATAGQQASKSPSVTLKLTVVISRFQDDKKTGSLPFILMVVPGRIVDTKEGPVGVDGDETSLQMGAEVPVLTGPRNNQTMPSYQYRSLGTSISANAKVVDDTRFSVMLNVTDSQIMSDVGPGGASQGLDMTPRFQSFKSTNRLLLRDGQTVQFTAATDKSSGEVVKLDVTLNVIK